MIRLHDDPLCGACYKVRLLLGFLGLAHETVGVDVYPGGEHLGAAFRRLNPRASVPVLEDEGVVLHDAHAILIYLAARYGPQDGWLPRAAARLGEMMQFMALAGELSACIGSARRHAILADDVACTAQRAQARDLLRLLEAHLWFGEQAKRAWICAGAHPSLADIACFAFIMLSEEAGIARQPFPAIRRWGDRVRLREGFVEMPGVFRM